MHNICISQSSTISPLAKQQFLTPQQALVKIAAYCAYQERTEQEVRRKLETYGLDGDEVDELIMRLSREKLLDEERYAQAYVRGKYGLKRWGRRLIVQGLKSKGISDYCVKSSLKEIDPEVYWENLLTVAEKQAAKVRGGVEWQRRQKNHPFSTRQRLRRRPRPGRHRGSAAPGK